MYLSEILNKKDIVADDKSIKKILSKNNYDYFVVELENKTNNKAYALLEFNSIGDSFRFMCAGEKGSWMLKVIDYFDGVFHEDVTCEVSDDVFDMAYNNGFNLVSSPSGVTEFQKNLEDGCVYINNDFWHENNDMPSVDINDNIWWVSRWNNSEENEKYIAIEEKYNLIDAIENSYFLVEIDMGTLPQQGFFQNVDNLRDSLVIEPQVVATY